MKKQIFTLCFIMLTALAFSNKTFAQGRDSGSSGSGEGTLPVQPCPISFTRNNGDGTCGGAAQIRLYFAQIPAFAPTLENIYYNGQPLYTNGYPISGNVADIATKGYISYCLPTSNIPPAIKLTIVFRYAGTLQDDCALSGTN